jgi:hypothetical protein
MSSKSNYEDGVSNVTSNSFFLEKGSRLVINPKVLIVPEFNELWERDRSVRKTKATKELIYVYLTSDFDSEYNAYGLSKEEQISIDVFGTKKYKPDPVVKKAIDKYEILQQTSSMRYLKAIRNRIDQNIAYLDKFMNIENKNDKPDFNAINQATMTMQKMEDVLEKLEKWEKKIYNEEEEMRIRGGGVLNIFEDPQSAEWNMKK